MVDYKEQNLWNGIDLDANLISIIFWLPKHGLIIYHLSDSDTVSIK